MALSHRVRQDSRTLSSRPVAGERPAFLDWWNPISQVGERAHSPVMIVFFRGFWCDYCRQQLAELANAAAAFTHLGVRIVAITTDVADDQEDSLSQTRRSFPVVIDRDGELISQLDLVDLFEFRSVPVSLPAVFLLDSAGVVRYLYIGRSPDDRPKTELLLLAAEHLT